MQAVALPARAGLRWAQDGWNLYRSQPLAFFSWAMFISLILMIASITPPVGPIVFVVLMPAVTFLTLCASREAAAGNKMLLGMWLQPLRQKPVLKRLLAMGAAYMVLCIIMGLIAFMPFMEELSESVQTATASNNLVPLLEAVRTPMIIFAIMYVLLASLFWYAPALVGWHGTSLMQALFFSGIACWRNKWAFMVYGLVWVGVFIGIDLAMSLLEMLSLSESMTATIQIPLNIVAGSILYCSFYPNYLSVFEAHDTGTNAKDEADNSASTD